MDIKLNSLITNINWTYNEGYHPEIELYDGESTLAIRLDNFDFRFKLSDERYCVGYVENSEYYPCKNNSLIGKGFERCKYCEDKIGFRSAFLFNQEPNENAKRYLSQKHFIYLAYFEPNIIKVGTASESRRFIRPIEQDALIYVFIAYQDGFQIQNLEKAISRILSVTQRVTSKAKFKTISVKPDISWVKILLLNKYKEILKNPQIQDDYGDWFIPHEELNIVDLTKKVNFVFPSELHEFKSNILFGGFIGLRGRYLILDNNTNLIGFDRKDLIGRRIESFIDYDYKYEVKKQEQIGMF